MDLAAPGAAPIPPGPPGQASGRAAGTADAVDTPSAPDPTGLPDPYSSALGTEDRTAWQAVTAEVDLHAEIRLLRTLLRRLAGEGLVEREVQVRLAMAVLLRLTQVQGRDPGIEAELERELADAAERVLALTEDGDDLDELGGPGSRTSTPL